jgi:hypothetical protein
MTCSALTRATIIHHSGLADLENGPQEPTEPDHLSSQSAQGVNEYR